VKPNIALRERILRVSVGVVLLMLAVIGPKTIWGLLGLVPFISGATGFCPLYYALGISSPPNLARHNRCGNPGASAGAATARLAVMVGPALERGRSGRLGMPPPVR
jgi:hypothetical protein